MFYRWKPYVSSAERRRQAERAVARFKKKGDIMKSVVLDGRAIAKTFWGRAWCDNLERYSDYSNRLPRGRTYVRNGSVIDLQDRARRTDGAGQRLQHLHSTCADHRGSQGAVERNLRRLCGCHRFPGRTVTGALFEWRDGTHLPAGHGVISIAEGNQIHLFLSGLGHNVQTCGCGTLRSRGPSRSKSRTIIRVAQSRP